MTSGHGEWVTWGPGAGGDAAGRLGGAAPGAVLSRTVPSLAGLGSRVCDRPGSALMGGSGGRGIPGP